MTAFRLPLPGSELLLSPRLAALPAALQWALLAATALLPLLLAARLYRAELRLVSRPAAVSLLGLRVAALLILWFLALWRPALARTVTETRPGRVVVAIDTSQSMGATDRLRPGLEKLRLARALRLADGVTDRQLDDWLLQYRERGRPQFLAAAAPSLAAEREKHDAVVGRVNALTRLQTASRLLGDGGGLLAALAEKHSVELLGSARESAGLSPEQLADLPPTAGNGGAFTDLRAALAAAGERAGGETPLLGVVLLTDGRHNWGPAPAGAAAELGERGVPVFPVPLGGAFDPPDAAVVAAQAPPAVFKGADVPVEARVRVVGLSPRELTVTLTVPGRPAPLVEKIDHDGKTTLYTVRFQARLERPGMLPLKVEVAGQPEEARRDNNARSAAVNVADDKARVLLADGEARWEFHYLAGALARDPVLALTPVVFAQPRLGRVAEAELAKAGMPALKLPPDPEALAGFDCLLLGDVSPEQLPPADRRRVERAVADGGKTLVVVAGKHFMPAGFLAAGTADPLSRLLPVEAVRAFSPDDGFAVSPTPEGRLAAFLQLDAGPAESAARWGRLPKHFWAAPGRAKPGAVVLAAVPGEPERESALIARHNYGFGRVLYVGLDSTWRWRYKAGDVYHHRFWGQVVRWAAADRPLVAGNESVRLGTREPVYRQGQDAELVVRLAEGVPAPGPEALAGARLFRKEGAGEVPAGVVALARPDGRPRELEAKLSDLSPGEYAVELAVPDLAGVLPAGTRAAFSVTPPDTSELTELAVNRPLLEELAAKSGGRVVEADAAGELVELLAAKSSSRTVVAETPLTRSWWALVAFVAVLTLEWAARKWAGLP